LKVVSSLFRTKAETSPEAGILALIRETIERMAGADPSQLALGVYEALRGEGIIPQSPRS
jgi:hypothetical protein